MRRAQWAEGRSAERQAAASIRSSKGEISRGETGRFLVEEREGGTQVVRVTLNFYGHFEFLLL